MQIKFQVLTPTAHGALPLKRTMTNARTRYGCKMARAHNYFGKTENEVCDDNVNYPSWATHLTQTRRNYTPRGPSI